jgi:hypothetical protein
MARQLGYHAVVAYRAVGQMIPPGDVLRRFESFLVSCGLTPTNSLARIESMIRNNEAARLSENADLVPSVARLLDLPFVTIGSPFDKLCRRALKATIDRLLAERPDATVEDLCEALRAVLGGQNAAVILAGASENPVRRAISLTGLDFPGSPSLVVEALRSGEIETLCVMDVPPAAIGKLSSLLAEHPERNLIVCSRTAALNAGIAPYIAAVRAEGIEVTPFAGVQDVT